MQAPWQTSPQFPVARRLPVRRRNVAEPECGAGAFKAVRMPSDARALGCGMKAIGARIARTLNRTFHRHGPVLAERFHLHVLRSPREVRNALAYVLLNARHHARRLATALRIDPASSARWFDGWRRQPAVAGQPAAVVPVVRARTWLLTIGWRRHGLIDPDEIPGSQ